MFDQLVSAKQEALSDLVEKKGGVKALKNDDKMLLSLDEAASETPHTEGRSAQRVNPNDAQLNVDDLKNDIFEDPGLALKKNQSVFVRKFEVQKRMLIKELTDAIRRDTDRVVRGTKGGPCERLLDRVSRLKDTHLLNVCS
jgi:hypothetical protein